LSASKLLVVNADDFGFTPDVNDGILEAHRNGILTATTLMAGGAAFEHAVELARLNPSLDVGCHLTLIGGNSLLPPHNLLPVSVPQLVKSVVCRQIVVYDEFLAQVRRILDSGVSLTHLDTHKHTLMLPSVATAVARVSKEFHIPWVRRPLAVPVLGPLLSIRLARHGCRMTDHFLGYRLTGRLDCEALVALIRRLPEGSSELMCHPGFLRGELRAARTRLKESRQRELEALTSPAARQALEETGVRLVNYPSLRRALP
jgi:chitin disaccharide deacetylase